MVRTRNPDAFRRGGRGSSQTTRIKVINDPFTAPTTHFFRVNGILKIINNRANTFKLTIGNNTVRGVSPVSIGDIIEFTNEQGVVYKFIIEKMDTTADTVTVEGAELGIIGAYKQLNSLNSYSRNADDILMGQREGPIINPVGVAQVIDIVSSAATDVELTAYIYGLDDSNVYKIEELAIEGVNIVTSTTLWSEVWFITFSRATLGDITVVDNPGANTLAIMKTGGLRLANTDAVGNYGNGITYKTYDRETPNMAIKCAEHFDNFNGAPELCGWALVSGVGVNNVLWASEGSHSYRLQDGVAVDGIFRKNVDLTDIRRIDFDVYLDTLGEFRFEVGGVPFYTNNVDAGMWLTVSVDVSVPVGVQQLDFIADDGVGPTDVYIDSIRYVNDAMITEFADDPLDEIHFSGINALSGIDHLSQITVPVATGKRYDWYIADNEDGESWEVTQALQLYFVPVRGNILAPVTTIKPGQANMQNQVDATKIVNRVTVYGGGDGTFQKSASQEDAASIVTYGVRQPSEPPTYPDIIDEAQLQAIADEIISKYANPFETSLVSLTVYSTKANVGDLVRIYNPVMNVDVNQRIFAKEYYFNQEVGIDLDFDEKESNIQDRLVLMDSIRNKISAGPLGAINQYMTGETQNVDTDHPCDVEFFFPDSMADVRHVNLNYAVEPYRTYHGKIPMDAAISRSYDFFYERKGAGTGSIILTGSIPDVDGLDTFPVAHEFMVTIMNRSPVNQTYVTILKAYNQYSGEYETIRTATDLVLPLQARTYNWLEYPNSDKYSGQACTLTVNANWVGAVPLDRWQQTTVNFRFGTHFGHDHDVLPAIDDVAKPTGLGMSIKIRQDAGVFNDVTTNLANLYGSVHTDTVGAAGSFIVYDLTKVFAFSENHWYTVRIEPTSADNLWWSYDTLKNYVNNANTAILANKLIDAGSNFIALGVEIGAKVTNGATGATAWVNAIDGANQLNLTSDIFPAFPVNYTIFGTWIYDPAYYDSGVTTGNAANKLIDAGATWESTEVVSIGDEVKNVTTGAITQVTAIDDDNNLSIAANIFPAPPGDTYRLYRQFPKNAENIGVDAIVKTEGVASTKFDIDVLPGEAVCFVTMTGTPLDLTSYRYLKVDFWPSAAANVNEMAFYLWSSVLANEGDELRAPMWWNTADWIIDGGGPLVFGNWNTIILDILNPTGQLNFDKTNAEGFSLHVDVDPSAASVNWRLDNLRYTADGLCRVRADVFNEFFLKKTDSI